MSPHAAAKIDGLEINLNDIKVPGTSNTLIIEGAGGLMVPLNSDGDFLIDYRFDKYLEIIIVSKNYLGSINHTLLTVEALKNRKLAIAGIIFNGISNPDSEEIILKKSGLKCLGRIPRTEKVDREFVLSEARKFAKF